MPVMLRRPRLRARRGRAPRPASARAAARETPRSARLSTRALAAEAVEQPLDPRRARLASAGWRCRRRSRPPARRRAPAPPRNPSGTTTTGSLKRRLAQLRLVVGRRRLHGVGLALEEVAQRRRMRRRRRRRPRAARRATRAWRPAPRSRAAPAARSAPTTPAPSAACAGRAARRRSSLRSTTQTAAIDALHARAAPLPARSGANASWTKASSKSRCAGLRRAARRPCRWPPCGRARRRRRCRTGARPPA